MCENGWVKKKDRKASVEEWGKFHLLLLEHSFLWEEEEQEKHAAFVELLIGVGELRMAPSGKMINPRWLQCACGFRKRRYRSLPTCEISSHSRK